MWLHIVSGSLIAAITLIFSVVGLRKLDYRILDTLHAKLGMSVLIITAAILISGIAAFFFMRKLKWRTSQVLSAKFAH